MRIDNGAEDFSADHFGAAQNGWILAASRRSESIR
jgi:hypothetical protein